MPYGILPPMKLREYGSDGPLVLVLHGGPAAVGDVAPVAEGISDSFRVLEPWQRGSGEERLTVVGHIEDLRTLISSYDARPAVVGHSWGAMLALCCAAAYPDLIGPVVLVGCGTFDATTRTRMKEILTARAPNSLQQDLAQARAVATDPGDLFMRCYRLTRDLFVYSKAKPWPEKDEFEPFDAQAHRETWEDMMRLQTDGTYPRAFSTIKSPVLMLHGAYDPHPGIMIRNSLIRFIPHLKYHAWERCGHSPWLERFARGSFFSALKQWLTTNIQKPN